MNIKGQKQTVQYSKIDLILLLVISISACAINTSLILESLIPQMNMTWQKIILVMILIYSSGIYLFLILKSIFQLYRQYKNSHR